MVIFSVEIKKLLIGQFWYYFRIPARFIGVRSIREECIKDHPVQHAFWR